MLATTRARNINPSDFRREYYNLGNEFLEQDEYYKFRHNS